MVILKDIRMKASYYYHVIVDGEWCVGFESRKTWKNKTYFGMGCIHYDIDYYYLHLGWFYLCVSY